MPTGAASKHQSVKGRAVNDPSYTVGSPSRVWKAPDFVVALLYAEAKTNSEAFLLRFGEPTT